MSTKMTEKDWVGALEIFRAPLPRRGDKGWDDRLFFKAMHYFSVHNTLLAGAAGAVRQMEQRAGLLLGAPPRDRGIARAHRQRPPDFATNAQRVRNRERLNALVNARIAERTVADWIGRLNRAGVPCGRAMDLAEIFADPQILAQDMVLEADHPGHGPVRMTGFPVKLSGTPAHLRHPAPALGEHTDEVLREAGYAPERIAALRAAGVI